MRQRRSEGARGGCRSPAVSLLSSAGVAAHTRGARRLRVVPRSILRGIPKHHWQGSTMKKFLKMLVIGTIIAAGCGAAAGAAESPDPAVGTWALNLAKSKFPPGAAPQSQTRVYT